MVLRLCARSAAAAAAVGVGAAAQRTAGAAPGASILNTRAACDRRAVWSCRLAAAACSTRAAPGAPRQPVTLDSLREVYRNAAFRNTISLLLIPHAVFFGLQGLWLGKWLGDVARLTADAQASVPATLAGRAATCLNLLIFVGAFLVQLGVRHADRAATAGPAALFPAPPGRRGGIR